MAGGSELCRRNQAEDAGADGSPFFPNEIDHAQAEGKRPADWAAETLTKEVLKCGAN